MSVCALEATLGGLGQGHQEGQGPLAGGRVGVRPRGCLGMGLVVWGFRLLRTVGGLCVSLASVVGGCLASLARMQ